MLDEYNHPTKFGGESWRRPVGAALIFGGGLVLLDQLLHLGWLAPISVLAGGMVLLFAGHRQHSMGFTIAGWIVGGIGLGLALWFDLRAGWTGIQKVGLFLLSTGAGFALVSASLHRWYARFIWWPLFPLAVFASVGFTLLTTTLRIVDFALSLGIGLGLAFVIVGLVEKWIGMIIPGCLLFGSGLGVYIPWGTTYASTALSKTGVMLVLFGIGWVLITLLSRAITHRFIWWPLIPGGLQAVVGWGLYIGGEPGNAVNFISNTGSIVILIMGIYLLLMRRGIHQ